MEHCYWKKHHNLVSIYLFKASSGNIKTLCGIWSELIIKTPERRQRRHFGVFIVNFERTLHLFLVFLLFNKTQFCRLVEVLWWWHPSKKYERFLHRTKNWFMLNDAFRAGDRKGFFFQKTETLVWIGLE